MQDLVLVSIGNSRTRIASGKLLADGRPGELQPAQVVATDDVDAQLAAITKRCDEALAGDDGPGDSAGVQLLLASVHQGAARALEERIASVPALPRPVRLGSVQGAGALRVPIATELDAGNVPGVDRLLTGLAAYDRTRGPCVVVDAGTAVTINLISEFGVFQGGIIAPGLRSMLRAMHQSADALPEVSAPLSDAEGVPEGPVGKNTRDAMLLGAMEAIRGLTQRMIERYAEVVGRYPRVIATGGDAGLLFRDEPLIEHIVPDLVLIGMQTAWARLENPGRFEEADGLEGGVPDGFSADDEDDGDER